MEQAITRRSLIKTFGAVAAAGVLGGSLTGFRGTNAFAEGKEDLKEQETKSLTCKMCMRGGCQGWTTLTNGVPTGIHGDDGFSYNQGSMCVRGKSAVMNVYNPYRVTTPMKRTNPKKGLDEDPGWIEISWDEALQETADRLSELVEEDPRQIVMYTGFALQDYEESMAKPLQSLLNLSNTYMGNGPLCAIHYSTCMVLASMPTTNSDMTYCRYLIDIGRSCGPNMATAIGNSRSLVDAQQKNGLRHIVIDPRCSTEASMGEWVPIRPGGDLAFVLAMANVMFYEIEKYDKRFLIDDTNACYLVNPDGLYAYDTHGTPQVWDSNSNAPVAYNKAGIDPVLDGTFVYGQQTVETGFHTVREGMREYTPEWAEGICEIPAERIRMIANDFVEAACIGRTIDVNGTAMPLRPAAIIAERGAQNHGNGHIVDLMTKLINELVGNLDVPGGIEGSLRGGMTMVPNADGVITPFMESSLEQNETFAYPPQHFDLHEYYPHRHSMSYTTFRTMNDPSAFGLDYEPKALIFGGGNPVISSTDTRLGAETIAKIPFVVDMAYHFDESTQLSDILLPVNSVLEYGCVKTFGMDYETLSDDAKSGRTYLVCRDPVDTVYNTRMPEDITIQLLDKMGLTADLNTMINASGIIDGNVPHPLTRENQLELDRPYTIMEMWDRDLKSSYGTSLDELKEKGYLVLDDMPLDKYYNRFLRKDDARYQFYFASQLQSFNILKGNLENAGASLDDVPGWNEEELTEHYEPVPKFMSIPLYEEDEYDLVAFNYKMPTSMFRFEAADQNAWLVDYSEKMVPDYKKVCINAATASDLNIQDGDQIAVESRTGKVTGTALVTQLVQKNAIGIGGAMGRLSDVTGPKAATGLYYNGLMTGDFGTFDPVMGATENAVRVKVYKA